MISATIESLKSLPLFNLSLASKELFHSEMLRWLGTQYPNVLDQALKHGFKVTPTWNVHRTAPDVRREHLRIDLSVSLSDRARLFVENKVKSIAGLDQLEKYDAAIAKWRTQEDARLRRAATKAKRDEDLPTANDVRVLLSLVRPSFVSLDNNTVTTEASQWTFVSYDALEDGLGAAVATGAVADKYHQALLDDYIRLLRGLLALRDAVSINWKVETFEFLKGAEFEVFKSVRLHDLYFKLKFEQIRVAVVEELGRRGSRAEVLRKPKTGYFVTSSGMTNSTGLAHFGFLLRDGEAREDRVVVGVQVQHDEFRLFIETQRDAARMSLATMCGTSQFGDPFVNFDRILTGSGDGLPDRAKRAHRTFQVRGTEVEFVYRYHRIAPNTLIASVVNLIADYCEEIVERQDYFRLVLGIGKSEGTT